MADDSGEPMPQPVKTAADLLAEAHEERLQRVERDAADTATQVAAMRERMEAGFDRLGEKIETCVAPLAERLSRHMDEDEKTNEKVSAAMETMAASASRLDKLEDKEQRRKDRLAALKKGAWAVALALIGAMFKACLDHMK